MLLFTLAVLLSANVLAQRVLYTSTDLAQPYDGPTLRNVRQHWALSPNITAVYADGHTEKVSRDSIWGYEDRKGRVYRFYRHGFYRLLPTSQKTDLVRYRQLRNAGRGVAYVRYFSQTLDSPVRWTKRKAQKDTVDVR